MRRILQDERGMALAVAIFALVVVGAMVAGAFFAGTQEQRVGENQRRVQTSFGIAVSLDRHRHDRPWPHQAERGAIAAPGTAWARTSS